METGATEYDVFLCHSSQDKAQVRILARELRARGLRVFLDEDEIIPGHPWQEVLEQAIQQSRSVAVVCGPSGIGPWAAHEIRASLDDLTRRGAPIIPVLLPDSPVASELPLFLRQFHWVDLREGLTDAGLVQLLRGVQGIGVSRAPSGNARRRRVRLGVSGAGLGALAVVAMAVIWAGSPMPGVPVALMDASAALPGAGSSSTPASHVAQRLNVAEQNTAPRVIDQEARASGGVVEVEGGINGVLNGPGTLIQSLEATDGGTLVVKNGLNAVVP